MKSTKTAICLVAAACLTACSSTGEGTSSANAPDVQALAFSFDWGAIPLCTTGNPNRVTNPTFRFRNLPEGTSQIQFRMKDLDVPGFNHGGGRASVSGGTAVVPGAFTYRSPCPPSGSHTYEWAATARNASGQVVGRGTATRNYP